MGSEGKFFVRIRFGFSIWIKARHLQTV